MPGKVSSISVYCYGAITDEQIAIINKAIISDPASGQHKIKSVVQLADKKWKVIFEGTPEP